MKAVNLQAPLSPWVSAQKKGFPLLGIYVKVNLSQGKARVGFGRPSNICFLNHPSVSEAVWKRHCIHFQVLQPSSYDEGVYNNLKIASSSNA